MKKLTIISICLIILGFLFECIHLGSDIQFFKIKFWLLGIIFITAGIMGLVWDNIIPTLEKRAKVLGQFKKNKRKNK